MTRFEATDREYALSQGVKWTPLRLGYSVPADYHLLLRPSNFGVCSVQEFLAFSRGYKMAIEIDRDPGRLKITPWISEFLTLTKWKIPSPEPYLFYQRDRPWLEVLEEIRNAYVDIVERWEPDNAAAEIMKAYKLEWNQTEAEAGPGE